MADPIAVGQIWGDPSGRTWKLIRILANGQVILDRGVSTAFVDANLLTKEGAGWKLLHGPMKGKADAGA